MEYYYVYVITFSNDKFYIGKRTSSVEPENDVNYWGSPVTFKYMWEDSSLQKEKHIIKICDTEKDVIELERNLILYSWRMYPDLCLNRNASPGFHYECCKLGGSITAAKYSKPITLKSPSGKIVSEVSIKEFCRKYDLDRSNIQRVLNRKQLYHNGWTLPEIIIDEEFKSNLTKMRGKITSEKYSKNFILKSPTGEIIFGKNIRKFCRENGLQPSNLISVLKCRYKSHKGWTLP